MKIKFSALHGRQLQKCSLALLMCFLAHVSDAQQLPNAGMLEKEAEQGFKNSPSLKAAPKETEHTKPAPPLAGELSVNVKAFEFSGNTLLSQESLNKALSPYLNQALSFAQLRSAADEVMNAYKAAGWMVRAYLPKQEIEGGVVRIDIIEGVLGGTQVDGDPSRLISSQQLINMGNRIIGVGQAVRVAKIDRALLLMDDLPGVSVTGNLVEGERAGQTNLSLQVLDQSRVEGTLSADNAGAVSTGASRVLLSANLNDPLRWGDLLTSNVLKSEGSTYARLGYTLPIGADGLRSGLHGSSLHYNLVGGFSSLGASGSASTAGVDAAYPLVRSQNDNLNLVGSWDHKWFTNEANQTVTSKYELFVGNVSLNGNSVDTWMGGGVLNYGLSLTRGFVNLVDSPNQLADLQSAHVAGLYSKANVNLSRLQTLTPTVIMSFALTAQMGNRNLDSSEKMYLGGASGIRAYPSNEGSGSSGQMLNVEIRKKVLQSWSVAGFYDVGHVSVYQDNQTNGGIALTGLNDFTLKGAGLSLAWQNFKGLDLKLTVARRILSNPIANASTGADTDGTLRMNRVWLNANVAF